MSLDDGNQASEAGGQTHLAFCQNCGRPLDAATIRNVGKAVYCEPCLEARLNGGPASANSGTGAAGQPAAGSIPGQMPGAGWQWGSGTPADWASKSGPNPGLAALLGFIPGVGAMYNEQYAKGIFHLLVFAVLISLSHASDLFGFFAFGWICYMVIEAHHTARARRDGTPLPNPFGLNDLGERLGFGRAWPSTNGSGGNPAGDPGGKAAYTAPPSGPASSDAGSYAPPRVPWSSTSDAFSSVPGAGYSAGYGAGYPPYAGGYVPPIPPFGAPISSGIPYGSADQPYVAPGYVPPGSVPPGPMPAAYVPPGSRFPAGAIWLIGLGVIFLFSTTGIFHMVFGWSLVGFVLIGLAVWVFLRRMLDSGVAVGNDGSPGYSLRVIRALGPSAWLFLIGVLLLLDAFQIVSWQRSWPLFIILAGVMALLQRAAYNSAAAAAFAVAQYPDGAAAGQGNRSGPDSQVATGPAEGPSTFERMDDSHPHQGGN